MILPIVLLDAYFSFADRKTDMVATRFIGGADVRRTDRRLTELFASFVLELTFMCMCICVYILRENAGGSSIRSIRMVRPDGEIECRMERWGLWLTGKMSPPTHSHDEHVRYWRGLLTSITREKEHSKSCLNRSLSPSHPIFLSHDETHPWATPLSSLCRQSEVGKGEASSALGGWLLYHDGEYDEYRISFPFPLLADG